MELLIAVIVIGIVAMLLLTRDRHEDDAHDVTQRAAGLDAERQFRRPPSEGDLL